MAIEQQGTASDPLPSVPPAIRQKILIGMRWAVWLSLLSAPFSYGISILFGRVSPEALGAYGFLSVYAGAVTSFLYLGGDAVVIKFLPELKPQERMPFLVTYFLVICLSLVPWLIVAMVWSELLRFALNDLGDASFQIVVLCLSPIYSFYTLVIASLKGLLEIRLAQVLVRGIAIGQFLLYGAMFVVSPEFLAIHYTKLIWATFLGLTLIAAGIGLRHLLRLTLSEGGRTLRRFFLPKGFWRYALSLQQVSMVWFFVQQIDYLLILHVGGLAMLGQYVAIASVALVSRIINNILLETFLPSLTNVAAASGQAMRLEVFSMYWRILLLVNIALCCGLMLFAGQILELFGPRFIGLQVPFLLLVFLTGLTSPTAVSTVVLTSVGKQQYSVWTGLSQMALFVALFFALWPQWEVLGAVVAHGVSVLLSDIVLMMIAIHKVALQMSVYRDYAAFVLVVVVTGGAAAGMSSLGVAAALALWACAMTLFLILGRYELVECKGLGRCFALISYRLTQQPGS